MPKALSLAWTAHQQPFLLLFFGSGAPGLFGRGIPSSLLVPRGLRAVAVVQQMTGQLERG